MNWYLVCIVLHVLATLLWFGHMFFWSMVVGPITKKIEPLETRQRLRRFSVRFGGLGWPALIILLVTGILMLQLRGFTFQEVFSAALLASPGGHILFFKFILVACMILYQLFIGHSPAPRLIYLNMLFALAILGLSVLLVRAPGYVEIDWSAFR